MLKIILKLMVAMKIIYIIQKKKKKKEKIAIGNKLKRKLGLFLFNALLHQIKAAVES